MMAGESEQPVSSARIERKETQKVQPERQPKRMADRMLACRYELKYLVTEIEAAPSTTSRT